MLLVRGNAIEGQTVPSLSIASTVTAWRIDIRACCKSKDLGCQMQVLIS